jgi:alanine-alpha-ketoisovalerate/valine-pyruvate aminotransferase
LNAAKNYPELSEQHITVPTFTEFLGTCLLNPSFLFSLLDEFLPYSDLMFMLDYKDALSIELSMQIVKEKNFQHRVILGALPFSFARVSFATSIPCSWLGSVDQDCNKLLARIKPEGVPLITDVSSTLGIATSYYTGFLNYYKIDHNIFGYILSPSTTMVCHSLIL